MPGASPDRPTAPAPAPSAPASPAAELAGRAGTAAGALGNAPRFKRRRHNALGSGAAACYASARVGHAAPGPLCRVAQLAAGARLPRPALDQCSHALRGIVWCDAAQRLAGAGAGVEGRPARVVDAAEGMGEEDGVGACRACQPGCGIAPGLTSLGGHSPLAAGTQPVFAGAGLSRPTLRLANRTKLSVDDAAGGGAIAHMPPRGAWVGAAQAAAAHLWQMGRPPGQQRSAWRRRWQEGKRHAGPPQAAAVPAPPPAHPPAPGPRPGSRRWSCTRHVACTSRSRLPGLLRTGTRPCT